MIPCLVLNAPGGGIIAQGRAQKIAHQLLFVQTVLGVAKLFEERGGHFNAVLLRGGENHIQFRLRPFVRFVLRRPRREFLLDKVLAAQKGCGKRAHGNQQRDQRRNEAYGYLALHDGLLSLLRKAAGERAHLLAKRGRDVGEHGLQRFLTENHRTLHSKITSRSSALRRAARARCSLLLNVVTGIPRDCAASFSE